MPLAEPFVKLQCNSLAFNSPTDNSQRTSPGSILARGPNLVVVVGISLGGGYQEEDGQLQQSLVTETLGYKGTPVT